MALTSSSGAARSLFALHLLVLSSVASTFAQVTFVKTDGTGDGSSWADAAGDLEAVLAEASPGNEIWVAGGTYTPTSCSPCGAAERAVSFVVPAGVAMRGGFAGNEDDAAERSSVNAPTVLSGDIDGDGELAGNSYNVVAIPAGGADTRLEGLTIAGGRADGGSGRDGGAGLIVGDGDDGTVATPTIVACRFAANASDGDGGAVRLEGRGGRVGPRFEGCTFSDNTGREGGAVFIQAYRGEASPAFVDCTFERNAGGAGGAVYTNAVEGAAAPRYLGCAFYDNHSRSYGGAVYNFGKEPGGACRAVLANCIFAGNRGDAAAGAVYNLASTGGLVRTRMTGCAFRANTSAVGGAVYVNGSEGHCRLEVTNSIFTESTAGYDPILHFSGSSDPEVYFAYCQVDATGPDDILEHEAGDLSVGPGMIYAADAGFVDPAGRDYRLLPDAPGIDAGSDSAYVALAVVEDAGGERRVQGPRADLGPFERADADGDGVGDEIDNCPAVANPEQVDADADGAGAACDCADDDASVHPGRPETCDGRDDDCDGEVDEDVDDRTPPEVECLDVTYFGRPGDTLRLSAAMVFAGGSDSCGPVEPVGVKPELLFGTGRFDVHLSAVDANGNAGTCRAGVEVVDAGKISAADCPADTAIVVAESEARAPEWPVPRAVTTCPLGGLTVRQSFGPAPGDRLPLGFSTIGFSLVDACGNRDSCQLRVFAAAEPVPLLVTCPSPDTVYLAEGADSMIVEWQPPGVESGCPGGAQLSQVGGPTNGGAFGPGTTAVAYAVEDSCGQRDTCRFEVVVVGERDADTTSSVLDPVAAELPGPRLVVAPNPAASLTYLRCAAPLRELSVASVAGTEVLRRRLADRREVELDVGALPPGLYVVTAHVSDGRRSVARLLVR